jgi:hypothetical protein
VWHKYASDGHLHVLVAMTIDWDCQRERGFSLLSMDNQCGRIALISIDKDNDHLAIAVIGAMMRAGTARVSQAGNVQIERLRDMETSMV